MCSCLSLFVPCRVPEGEILHGCQVELQDASSPNATLHAVKALWRCPRSWMCGLGGDRVLRALASHWLPTAVSVFTADFFIIRLPNLLFWMHIFSLDEFSSDEEILSVHIWFCDCNSKFHVICNLYLLVIKTFGFLQEFNVYRHPYIHFFALYIYTHAYHSYSRQHKETFHWCKKTNELFFFWGCFVKMFLFSFLTSSSLFYNCFIKSKFNAFL